MPTLPDYTGSLPDHKKLAEAVSVPANKIFMPAEGVFYTQSVVLYDNVNQRTLNPFVDYMFLQFESSVIAKSAQEAASYIAIKNPAVSNNLTLQEYQFVGGFFQSYPALVQPVLVDLSLDISTLVNGEIIHSPDLFPEEHVLRTNAATFSCEFMVWAIEQITQALLMGNEEEHQAIRDRINALLAQVSTLIPQGIATVNNHLTDYNNPHQTNAGDLNAYLTTQIDQLLFDKLGINETAVNTNAIDNKSYATALTELRSNLDVSLITQNQLPYSKMISGYDAGAGLQVLTAGGWSSSLSFLQTSAPVFFFGNTLDGLMATFQNSPIGTTVTMRQLWAATGKGTGWWKIGDDTYITNVNARVTYRRTGPGYSDWTPVYY